jgi:hypothetical protein
LYFFNEMLYYSTDRVPGSQKAGPGNWWSVGSVPEPEPENETDDETVENCESRFVKERKPIFVSESQTGYVNLG